MTVFFNNVSHKNKGVFSGKNAPSYSKIVTEEELNLSDDSFLVEDLEEEEEVNYSTEYKKLLVDYTYTQYDGIYSKNYIKERIEILFPEKNFYYFKIKEYDE